MVGVFYFEVRVLFLFGFDVIFNIDSIEVGSFGNFCGVILSGGCFCFGV